MGPFLARGSPDYDVGLTGKGKGALRLRVIHGATLSMPAVDLGDPRRYRLPGDRPGNRNIL